MDGSAFDAVARTVARLNSRRHLVRLLTGLPVVSLFATLEREAGTDARGRKAHRHQAQHQHRHAQTQRRKDRRDETHAEACIPTGQRCPSKKPRGKHAKKLGCERCCQGSFITDATGKKVCGCLPNGGACTTATTTSCCSGFCNGATCQAAPCSAALPCPQCQTCNASTGLCEAVANGTGCDDGNACTQTDTCQGGFCAGTNPVVCTPLDQCHNAGTCDPATGVCSNLTKPDATSCGSGHLCCGGTCVDPQTDPANCGSCGHACPAATEICDGGTCRACDVCATCPHTTVQAAINATPSGGTVRVCAGTYPRSGVAAVANFDSKTLTLIGAGPGATVLTGGGVFSGNGVVECSNATANLRQLTITGSNGQSGVAVHPGSTATLADVTVTGNTTDLGGGIHIDRGGSAILNAGTSVTGNSAGRAGGGIYSDGSVTMNSGSSVTENSAPDGGGIRNVGGTVTLNAGSLVCNNSVPQCSGFSPPSGFCGACP